MIRGLTPTEFKGGVKMVTLVTMLMFIVGVFIVVYGIFWVVHINMTKESTQKYGWGNYETFLREFKKCNWENRGWEESLFDYETNSQLHASIIKFKGKGMLLDPLSYLRVVIFVRRYIKNHIDEKEVVQW